MAGPSSTSSAAEWLDAAPGAGFDGGRAASGGGDGERELKRHNDGAGVGTDICGVDGGLEGAFSGIGVQHCHCDCGEVIRKPRMKTLVDDLDDDEDGWMNCLCQECGDCCEVCGARLGCHGQVRKLLLYVGGICSECRQCDLGLQNLQKSKDRLLDIARKMTCCKQQKAKQVTRTDRAHGVVFHTARYRF